MKITLKDFDWETGEESIITVTTDEIDFALDAGCGFFIADNDAWTVHTSDIISVTD